MNEIAPQPPKLATVEEVAEALSVKRSTVRAWARDGKLPSHVYMKIGGMYRFYLDDLLDYLRQNQLLEKPQPGEEDLRKELLRLQKENQALKEQQRQSKPIVLDEPLEDQYFGE